MKVGIKKLENFKGDLPTYATKGSAGFDLRAQLEVKSIMIHPGERKLIQTGLAFSLPSGYELQIRPRSGIALKWGVTVVNSPGTVDEDFLGEVGVILINHGTESFIIQDGDRIAQAVLNKVERAEFEAVEELATTERGTGGFGHSGIK